MIPKVIHYIWFGGEKTKLALKCIESWKKFCPDYQIVEWNESNFDVSKSKHCAQAYSAKKYGFAVDYARYDILYNNGGIYVDTDVEFIKKIDDLLDAHAIVGYESVNEIATGQIIAAEKGNPFMKELMLLYRDMDFVDQNGNLLMVTSTVIITDLLRQKYGLRCDNSYQEIEELGLKIYPTEYFQPIVDNKLLLTENTYSIHYFSSSWRDGDYSARKEYVALYGRKIGIILYVLRHPIKSIRKFFNNKK